MSDMDELVEKAAEELDGLTDLAREVLEAAGLPALLERVDVAEAALARVEALCIAAESFEGMSGTRGNTILPSTVWTKVRGRMIRHQDLRAALDASETP